MDTKTARIRALNDELRQHITGGMAVITLGVAALGVSRAGAFTFRHPGCHSPVICALQRPVRGRIGTVEWLTRPGRRERRGSWPIKCHST